MFPPGALSATVRSRATWSEVQAAMPPHQRMLAPGCYRCSSPLRTKLSPPFPGPPKSPTAAGIRLSGLGVRERNDTVNLSPNADLSPKLGAWPIYSTSFFGRDSRRLVLLWNRKVGIPFAYLFLGWTSPTSLIQPPLPRPVMPRSISASNTPAWAAMLQAISHAEAPTWPGAAGWCRSRRCRHSPICRR